MGQVWVKEDERGATEESTGKSLMKDLYDDKN